MLTAGFGRRTPYTQYTIRNTQYAVCLKGGRRTIRNTQYAIRNHAHSRLRASHPIRNTQYAIRNHAHSRPSGVAPHTQYAIRNTQYATCLTEPSCQYAKPSLNTQSLNTLRIPYVTPLIYLSNFRLVTLERFRDRVAITSNLPCRRRSRKG